MYIVIKIEYNYNIKNTYKFNKFIDAKEHIIKILQDFCRCQIIVNNYVIEYCMKQLLNKGYIYIWELIRTLAHSAYPYEHHRIVLIDTSKLQ